MRAWIPALALALPAMAGAAGFENPKTGYKVEVPAQFQHQYDAKTDTLWVAARGGMRVRVETREDGSALDGRTVGSWYKRDGLALKKSSDKFQVIRKPVPDKSFGEEHPGFLYAFAYASDSGVGRAVAYLSDGAAKSPGERLQIRVLAYGPARALQVHEDDLVLMVSSFGWPGAATPPPDTAGGTQVATISPGTTTGGDPALVVDTPPGTGRKNDGGPSTSYRPTGDFSRGSLSGGLGAMEGAGVVQNEALMNAMRARYGNLGKQRTEQQQQKAAGYLGFKRKK